MIMSEYKLIDEIKKAASKSNILKDQTLTQTAAEYLNERQNISNKPPLGLKPKYIHDIHRKQDIAQAIVRYLESNKAIPMEWIDEWNELNGISVKSDSSYYTKRINEQQYPSYILGKWHLSLETEQIKKLWHLCYDNRQNYSTLFDMLEDIRPAGGFDNRSDST